MMPIRFTRHARTKFGLLAAHGFPVREDQVVAAILEPDIVVQGKKGRRVVQKAMDVDHVLRVVLEDYKDGVLVVTFYPGRRSRYEGAV